MPPKAKKQIVAIMKLKPRLVRNTAISVTSSPAFCTTPLVMLPYTLIGEKPPACAPWITSRPIISGLMWYCLAKRSATGPMIATAAGPSAPKAVSTAVITNITHGMATIWPRTAFTAQCTSRSMVPFFCAMANR